MADDVKYGLVTEQDLTVLAEAFNLLVQGRFDGVRGGEFGKAASVVEGFQSVIARLAQEIQQGGDDATE